MEDDNQEDRSSGVAYHRSRNFRKKEVKALVNEISKYKHIILNKCTKSTTNQAKDEVWEKICKEINSQGFEHKRSVDVLKTKWLNLKREAKKLSRNIIDANCTNINNVISQVVMMINENEANPSITEAPQEDKYPLKLEDAVEGNDNDLWDGNDQSDESNDDSDDDDDGDESKRNKRSLNFTPSECSLLLRCVREEKHNILRGRGCSRTAIQIASSAWHRITQKYNKQSTLKRSTKMLRTKFGNMKKLATFKKESRKHLKNERSEDPVEVKFEPNIESSNFVLHKDNENDDCEDDYMETNDSNAQNEANSDPLCMVLNGDSGMESLSYSGSYSQFDSKEVVKLKIELLKYQLETAKMERQRIKEALDAEMSDRQSKAIEASLRLRAARLQAVACELKLPSAHPALQYSEREKLAEQYIRHFEINKTESDID